MELTECDQRFAQLQCMAYGFPENFGDPKRTKEDDKTKEVGLEFFTVKKVKLELTLHEPSLRYHYQKFLEMERVAHQANLHPGGIESEVTLNGFLSRRYEATVVELLNERKQVLG